jgi:ubiquinone/menaquinone biosynthesis C-methylase UbiE
MTPEMIERARRSTGEHGYEGVEFRLGEIEHLPVADASVDVVLSNCVINLVPDKRAAFAEMVRVLRPGGRICISDIVSYGTIPPEVRESVDLYTGCVAGAMDRAAYLALIEDAGLARAEVLAERSLPPFNGPQWGVLSVTVGAHRPTD